MKQLVKYRSLLFLGIGYLIILYLMNDTYHDIARSQSKLVDSGTKYIKFSALAFCIGLLIEWRSIKKLFSGNVRLHINIVFPIVFAIICFIPETYWVQKLGLGRMFILDSLQITSIKTVMTTLSAVILIRNLQTNGTD